MESGAQSLTLLALLLPFLGAALAPLLCRVLKHNAAWLLALAPTLIFIHLAGLVGQVAGGQPVSGGYDWIPSLGIRFSWYLDGLSLTFAPADLGHRRVDRALFRRLPEGPPAAGPVPRLHPAVHGGDARAGRLPTTCLMLFVFWELTSITSFLLIGFDHRRRGGAPRGAAGAGGHRRAAGCRCSPACC